MKQNTNRALYVAMSKEDMMQLFGGSIKSSSGINADSIAINTEDWKEWIRNHGGCVFF